MASITQSTHVIVQQLRHQLNDMTEMLRHERNLSTQNNSNAHDVATSVRRIENHLMGERPESPRFTSPLTVIKFTTSSKGLTNQNSVSDVFVAFFDEDYRAGYALDLNSESWKEDMDPIERKSHKNKFASIKRVVRMVLMHADSHPSMPEVPPKCKEVLRRIATAAEEHIRNDLRFENKRISVATLTSHPMTEDLEKTPSLPANTPEDICKFFGAKS